MRVFKLCAYTGLGYKYIEIYTGLPQNLEKLGKCSLFEKFIENLEKSEVR